MNLLDVIKTGKNFQRPRTGVVYINTPFNSFLIPRADILEEDWEVEPMQKMISFQAIVDAYKEVCSDRRFQYCPESYATKREIVELNFIKKISKKLGLV